jgi:UTP--glucose-1-phosphate uridylyltransferase
MHVLTPTIFKILDEHVASARDAGNIQLTPALQQLAQSEKYLAVQTNGRRYNIGVKFGSLEAQIALAMAGRDRDEVLMRLMELMIQAGVRTESV